MLHTIIGLVIIVGIILVVGRLVLIGRKEGQVKLPDPVEKIIVKLEEKNILPKDGE